MRNFSMQYNFPANNIVIKAKGERFRLFSTNGEQPSLSNAFFKQLTVQAGTRQKERLQWTIHSEGLDPRSTKTISYYLNLK